MGRARGARAADGGSGGGPVSNQEDVRVVPPTLGRESSKRLRSSRETIPEQAIAKDEEDYQSEHDTQAEDDPDTPENDVGTDHDETEDEVEIDEDDPVAVLTAQGVPESVAKNALARTNGDLDAAVMWVVHQRVLEKEEKEMAKVMEESLREAETQAWKRDEEEARSKTEAPTEFFAGSAFLVALGELGTALLRDYCPAKADVIETLEFEKKCRKWYRNSVCEVDEKFAAVGGEIVASCGGAAGGFAKDRARNKQARGAGETGPESGAKQETSAGETDTDSGGGGGGAGAVSMKKAHAMLLVHLKALKNAVLAMPHGPSGSVPDVFSPSKDKRAEEIDLTAE